MKVASSPVFICDSLDITLGKFFVAPIFDELEQIICQAVFSCLMLL